MISVIVPVYNVEPYVRKCLDSVINQTYRDLEIILVDDGSTDGTAALCDVLETKDIRVRVFHKENGGSSSARNLGLKHATGDYIGFVDSDDYIEPDMYELLADAVVRNNSLMAQISRDEINEDGSKRGDVCIPPEKEIVITGKDMLKELLMHRGDCSFCTRICARELFNERSFPEGELNEDFRLLTEMLPFIDSFPILPKQCYHVYYRMNSNSRRSDRDDFSRVFEDIVVNADRIQKTVDERYPELREVAFRFGMVQRLDYMLHIPISMMTADNKFYREVAIYMRKNRLNALKNRILTNKNKLYILLLGTAPKTVRSIHEKKMKRRGNI